MAEANAAEETSEKSWYLHAGFTALFFEPSATVTAGGQPVPGAAVSIGNNYTLGVQLGWFFWDNFALQFTGGIPPTATVSGSGSLSTAGVLGKATYGPLLLTALYHFRQLGIVQPYIGGGMTVVWVFGTTDGSLTKLSVPSAVGGVATVGLDVMITKQWGVFAEVDKLWVKTTATGYLGTAPVSANLTLNPWVLLVGGTFRF